VTFSLPPDLPDAAPFTLECRRCSRLVAFLRQVKRDHPCYRCQPVPSFGDADARLLVVGLAPGMHGANATGRPFTGDYAGLLLYSTLHEYGFASSSRSTAADDGLRLSDCRITNAVRCLPPQNKPMSAEVNNCNAYLHQELAQLPQDAVVLALGSVAHRAVVRALAEKQKNLPFSHGAEHRPACGILLIDSYHCSRYNTNTKRLTREMFRAVFERIRMHLPHDH
jgi:uracil-DNA glycosylase